MPGKRHGVHTLGLIIICLCLMTPLVNAGTPTANKATPTVKQDSITRSVAKSLGDGWIEVFGISVGYGVHATLFASYDMDAINISWNISIIGGRFHHIHSYTNGTIPIIYAGDTVTIYSHVPFGFGPVTIFMTVFWPDGSWEKQMIGKQCFRYTELGKNRVSAATQDSVTFSHYPPNGLYWASHSTGNYRVTIGSYPVPLFLRDSGGGLDAIGNNVTGDNISRVEFWFKGNLLANLTAPPYIWGIMPGPYLPVFGHSPTYTTKVYMDDGQIIWDNFTVYRLF